jgi:DNA-binding GntR family transcriptional regulator
MPSCLVDHLSPEALYLQLAKILRARITSGELPVGSRLAEKALATEHGIARGTVRKALQVLEREGLVRPLPRRGWGVVHPG